LADEWRLTEVTVHEQALGDKVTLALEDSRTILVGRNGVGKSLLLEALNEAATLAVSRFAHRASTIWSFDCQLTNGNSRLRYEFTQEPRARTSEEDAHSIVPSWDWRERCRRVPSNETLWEVADGVAKVKGQEIKLERGVGLLAVAPPASVRLPPELSAIRSVMLRVRRISAGVPRRSEPRNPMFLMRASMAPGKGWAVVGGRPDPRVDGIARTIMNWQQVNKGRFDEYAAVGRRLGLWDTLSGKVVQENVTGLAADNEARDLGVVAADGINFACLSDGTLRTAEILSFLLTATSLLLIEEPETSIHPGLLRRLLSEIESYSIDKQVIISTHSPDVVSKATPAEIRVVDRASHRTTVQRLPEEAIGRLCQYLLDEGTLGEFIFGGGATSG
jgi:predicted ATPase